MEAFSQWFSLPSVALKNNHIHQVQKGSQEELAVSTEEKNTLEFEEQDQFPSLALKDEDAKKLMRGSFRIPIGNEDQISVRLEGAVFQVLNISEGGIGLLIKNPEGGLKEGWMGTLLMSIEGKEWNVQARVSHLSPYDSGDFICGLQFMEVSPQLEQSLNEFLSRTRKKWLKTR